MDDLQLIREVRALYGGNPCRWGQHKYNTGERWCLTGATLAVRGLPDRLARTLGFRRALFRFTKASAMHAMQEWNDVPGRTFAEVDARLEAAQHRLERAQGSGGT